MTPGDSRGVLHIAKDITDCITSWPLAWGFSLGSVAAF